jgi:hypothetical protein
MNIEFGHYTGEMSRHEGKSTGKVVMPYAPLRQLIALEWPDVKLPTHLVLMPEEDYRVILGDLVGHPMTPHRHAIGFRITKEDPTPATRGQSKTGKWVERGILWAIALLAAYGLVDALTRLAGILPHLP